MLVKSFTLTGWKASLVLAASLFIIGEGLWQTVALILRIVLDSK